MTDADVTTAELLAAHDPMAWKLAHAWHRKNPDVDLDDLHAEVRLGFLRAAARFDPARGRTFLTYAVLWGNECARRFLRRELARGMHVPAYRGLVRVAVGSIDAPESRTSGAAEARGFRAAAPAPEPVPEFPPDFWDRVRRVLPRLQWRVVVLRYRDGLNLREAGRRCGFTRARAGQLRDDALARLRRLLPGLEEYLDD